MKDIQLSPNISDNDMSYRVKQVNKFLEKGEQVRITLTFKGRENLHVDIGMNTIKGFIAECTSGTLASGLKITEGRRKTISGVLNPKKGTKKGS